MTPLYEADLIGIFVVVLFIQIVIGKIIYEIILDKIQDIIHAKHDEIRNKVHKQNIEIHQLKSKLTLLESQIKTSTKDNHRESPLEMLIRDTMNAAKEYLKKKGGGHGTD